MVKHCTYIPQCAVFDVKMFTDMNAYVVLPKKLMKPISKNVNKDDVFFKKVLHSYVYVEKTCQYMYICLRNIHI